MNNLLDIYSNNSIDYILLNKVLQMKIIEIKTKIYRKIYNYIDPIIDNNYILNDNTINNYLLTTDTDKNINKKWKILNNNIINDILKYYKLYINQDYKTSIFLYNCSNCFSIYVNSRKTTLPSITSKEKRRFSKDSKILSHKRGSIMIPFINNDCSFENINYRNINEINDINPKLLIKIYNDIINYCINEQEYDILRKASEELFNLYYDNIENSSVLKFINLSLFQSCEMQKTMKKILIENTPQDSQVYYIVSKFKEKDEPDKKYIKLLSKKTTCWKRYLILKNYIDLIYNLPPNFQILILQHSSSKKKLLSGMFKNIPNKKASPNNQQEEENNEPCNAFTLKTEVDYQQWEKLIESFTHEIYNFENSSYVIDKIIEEIVTKRVSEDDFKKKQEKEFQISSENEQEKNNESTRFSSIFNEEKKPIPLHLSNLDENLTQIITPKITEKTSLPSLMISTNKTNNSISARNHTDESNYQKEPKIILSFPRLMTNIDISQTGPIYNPDLTVHNIKYSSMSKVNKIKENIDCIYTNMDDNIKKACNNDKEQFFKLYNILYQIFEHLYPTLYEIRKQMNSKDNNTGLEQKKKKKDKSNSSDINFDLHTILCCDTSFFNIPIETYIQYMLNINIVNRDFCTNLLLHRLITQSYQNNLSSEANNNEVNTDDNNRKKEKNKKQKKINPIENCISQLNNFNYVLNGIPNKTESLIINIPYFKNIVKKYKITKWNGIASYMTSLSEILFYLNSPSFLYISYIPISLKIYKEQLNLNLNNTRTAIFIDYINIIDEHKVIDIKLLNKTDEFMLFLSLQGINNICFQPYCNTQYINDLIIKSILDTSNPIDLFFYNLFIKCQVQRTAFRLYGIPNIINTKNNPE
ncbi:hypothetical protein BCR36DRAFT_18967 [Piromyces finnis]|uniref:Uncharacterized protein n=1 Tax=Piromyces finnis TaxID=1754191 RepID=A0A1Y1UL79_9FUNG|nr:hypothetical protein BCR36DRAFT_18967 [Piromyces finnis]|eukprot:ORX38801.1 hypothetical protein BCR36DRAFT_18967 [Piromyces finnis]